MKKSLLFIPSIVAITTTPFIGLTSCFESEDDPTPPGPTPRPSWEVTTQEMEEAISFNGVQYLQIQTNFEGTGFISDAPIGSALGLGIGIFSPKAFKTQEIEIEQYVGSKPTVNQNSEQRGIVDDGEETFTGYYRNLKEKQPQWTTIPKQDMKDFQRIDKITMFTDMYNKVISSGESFLADSVNHCYTASIIDGVKNGQLSFYFNNKKLVKAHYYELESEDLTKTITTEDFNLWYQEITPVEPKVDDIDLDLNLTSEEGIPALTNDDGIVIKTDNEYDIHFDSFSCDDATKWMSNTSYLYFIDESGYPITDLDIEVVFYSVNDDIFYQGISEEREPGYYYYLNGGSVLLGVTQEKFDLEFPINSYIYVKFNNHEGEKIYPVWTNKI